MADAGRAMMLYRGLYESTHTYEKLDVVNFNGSLYISTTDGNLGTEPTDETKWKLFLQGGVADNIQATDTYGLVGEAGGGSFVQLLLDSLASRIQGVALNQQTLGYSKKNLLKKGNFTSQTSNGITLTVNEDNSITVNGTATVNFERYFGYFKPTPNKTYNFTANSGSVNHKRVCYIKGIDDNAAWKYEGLDGNDKNNYIFTPTTDTNIVCHIYIASGTTVENLTFYPMIRSAEITNSTYEPYVDDVDTRLDKIDNSILNTLEEIEANTDPDMIASALAVKELYNLVKNK